MVEDFLKMRVFGMIRQMDSHGAKLILIECSKVDDPGKRYPVAIESSGELDKLGHFPIIRSLDNEIEFGPEQVRFFQTSDEIEVFE